MTGPILHSVATPPPFDVMFSNMHIAAVTYAHPPVFTVQDGAAFKSLIPGGHTKNLFLRDKKENMFLVTALQDTAIDLKKLSDHVQAGRLSFGSADRLQRVLGVTPGSVTPLALINDHARAVQVILDAALFDQDQVSCHPLRNDRTTVLKTQDLQRFIETLGYAPRRIDFSAI
jgi:Ala-tRNA(Pro) deacylase